MLDRLEIQNFRSIRSQSIEFAPLTVLVGENSAGKSTLLRAIAFMAHVAAEGSFGDEVILSSPHLPIGDFDELVHSSNPEGTISLRATLSRPVVSPEGREIGQATASDWELVPPGRATPASAEPVDGSSSNEFEWAIEFSRAVGRPGVASLARTEIIDRGEDLRLTAHPIYDPSQQASVSLQSRESFELLNQYLGSIDIDGFAIPPDSHWLSASLDRLSEPNRAEPLAYKSKSDNVSRHMLELAEFEEVAFLSDQTLGTMLVNDYCEREIDPMRSCAAAFSSALPQLFSYPSDDFARKAWQWAVLVRRATQQAHQITDSDGEFVDHLLESLGAKRFPDWFGPPRANYLNITTVRHVFDPRDGSWKEIPQVPEPFQEKRAMDLLVDRFVDWMQATEAGKLADEAVIPLPEVFAFDGDYLLNCVRAGWSARFPSLLRDRLRERWESGGLPVGFAPSLVYSARNLPLWAATSHIRSSFRSNLLYLGPLRIDTSASVGFETGRGITPVGAKGEFAGSVLFGHRSTRVDVPMPPDTPDSPEGLTLEEAVSAWAGYLGVSQKISVSDPSRSGPEFVVTDAQTAEKRRVSDLGVGVSQLLPVLVICLMSKPGQLILLEQPELHLHPGPQQRLGDFLLAIASSGRQLIVETHSEYLVNRLRLRKAERADESSAETASILYARREDGATRYDELAINDYGSIDEWPEGFFDQAAGEARSILKAALRKASGLGGDAG